MAMQKRQKYAFALVYISIASNWYGSFISSSGSKLVASAAFTGTAQSYL